MIESHLFKRLKFIYEGVNYQEKIRAQVLELKLRYEGVLNRGDLGGKGIIPTINSRGKLIFGNEEEDIKIE